MFASKSIGEHLLRGAVGAGAVVAAVTLADRGWPPLVLLPLALLALRGCPMCWTVGLVETVWARFRGRDPRAACVDGSCALVNTTRVEDERI
jgi:hypothetical protein